jgi:hypothetical protein
MKRRHDAKNLIVYGCSLTKDNYIDTWADVLSNRFNFSLTNYAERGAGYDYLLQRLFTTDSFDDSLVIIMWPTSDRWDLYVNDSVPHLQDDLEYASWLDGESPSFVDYSGLYNTNHGWLVNGGVPRGYKHLYYKYFYTQTMHVNHAWTTIVAAQKFLDSKQVQYVMCNSYPIRNPTQYHFDTTQDFNWRLYDAIDMGKFVTGAADTGFIQITRDNKLGFINPHYPDRDAHEFYVDNYILPVL